MKIEDATQADANRLNAICGYPRVGRNARTGRLANVPADYAERVANGERVPGVTAYYLDDELEVESVDRDGVPTMRATGRKVVQVGDDDAAKLQAFDPGPTREKLRAIAAGQPGRSEKATAASRPGGRT